MYALLFVLVQYQVLYTLTPNIQYLRLAKDYSLHPHNSNTPDSPETPINVNTHTTFIGLAVDYSLHVAHAYTHAHEASEPSMVGQ